jgi:hypothetical protein
VMRVKCKSVEEWFLLKFQYRFTFKNISKPFHFQNGNILSFWINKKIRPTDVNSNMFHSLINFPSRCWFGVLVFEGYKSRVRFVIHINVLLVHSRWFRRLILIWFRVGVCVKRSMDSFYAAAI